MVSMLVIVAMVFVVGGGAPLSPSARVWGRYSIFGYLDPLGEGSAWFRCPDLEFLGGVLTMAPVVSDSSGWPECSSSGWLQASAFP